MVCLGLGVAVSAHLLLSSVRQLFLVQAEDVMHELVLFTGLDHPTSEKHTGSTKNSCDKKQNEFHFAVLTEMLTVVNSC